MALDHGFETGNPMEGIGVDAALFWETSIVVREVTG